MRNVAALLPSFMSFVMACSAELPDGAEERSPLATEVLWDLADGCVPARARLVETPDGVSIIVGTDAGVRWFGIDEEGLVVASSPLFKPHDRSEGVALAPLSGGSLLA